MEQYPTQMTLLQQGAEAKLYETKFFGHDCFVKERFPKLYRLPEIDEKLTRKRVTQEVRALQRCRKVGIFTPAIYFVDMIKNIIFLEKINGSTVREYVIACRKNSSSDSYESLLPVASVIGGILAKMHNADIIHGDLTTSNMIISTDTKTSKQITCSDVYLIDFGLSTSSSLAEDKGVDLYVLERAFLSTHPGSEDLFSAMLESYKLVSKNSKSVLNKLEEVRSRGRKRSMLG